MKRLIFSLLSTMLLVSCADEAPVCMTDNTDAITFKVSIPSLEDMRTRVEGDAGYAYGDGSTVNELRYYIYNKNDEDGTEPLLSDRVDIMDYKGLRGASLDVQLPKDQEYETVFLATACDQTDADSKVYYNSAERTLNVNYAKISSNDESVDCFFGVIDNVSADRYNYSVTLKRPFAQLNIGDKGVLAGSDIETAGVTVKGVYSSMNVMDGSLVGNPIDATLSSSTLPSDYSFPVSDVGYLAMNYLLVNEQKDVDVILVTSDGQNISNTEFTEVPLKRNCQTNIYGNLFEAENDFVIELNPDFSGGNINNNLDDPYADYDLVLTIVDVTNPYINLTITKDNVAKTIDLSPYLDSKNTIKVTWAEIGIDKADNISFNTTSGKRSSLKELIKCDISKLDVTSLNKTFYYCSNLISVNAIKDWDLSNISDLSNTFEFCIRLTNIDLSNWDTSKVTTLEGTFQNCSKLTGIDVSNWDTSKVTTLNHTFYSCSKLTGIDVSNWDTSNVTTLNSTFSGCSKLTSIDVSNWDTSKVTTLYGTFYYCLNLTSIDVSNWDTSNVTTLHQTFYRCYSLNNLNLSNWDTSNVTDLEGTFWFCTNLTGIDVSNWDTSNVTTLNYTFSDCSNLTGIDVSNWDTSKVTTLYETFAGCSNLASIDVSNWDTSNVTTFYETFAGCSKLITLKVSEWNMTKATNVNNMFMACKNLINIIGAIHNLSVSLDLNYCPLSNDSAMVFINGLSLVSSSRTIRLSSLTYSSLTDEQMAIAQNKGWKISL